MSSSIPSPPPLHLPLSSLSFVTISDCVIFFLHFTVSLFSLYFILSAFFLFCLLPSPYSHILSFSLSQPLSPTLSHLPLPSE